LNLLLGHLRLFFVDESFVLETCLLIDHRSLLVTFGSQSARSDERIATVGSVEENIVLVCQLGITQEKEAFIFTKALKLLSQVGFNVTHLINR
jgi:hypothetical protein